MAQTGITAFDKTLIGAETSAGSTDLPSTHWRGTGVLKDMREIVFPTQRVGKLGGTTRSYTPKTGGEVTLEDEATFEYLPYILNAGLYLTTPTTEASSAEIRTWNVQASSSDPIATTDLATLVIEGGDNIQAEIMHFGYVKAFTLSGAQGEAVKVTATVPGRSPETTTFTAVGDTDLANPFETILTSMGKLYIDPSTDTPGTTQKTLTLIDFSLKHTTGWVELAAKDGRTDFSDIKHVDDEITLEITFEHNGIAVAEKAAWRAETERVIRLRFDGSALSSTDGGATYDQKALIVDMWGKWSKFGAEGLEDKDGDNTYKGIFRVAYSQLAANKMRYIVVNELSVLP